MKNKCCLHIIFVLIALLVFSSCKHYPPFSEPDTNIFKSKVKSSKLIDSLVEGKLVPGMPYSTVTDIFKDWTDNIKEIKIPVPYIGSRQRIEDMEGLGRVSANPYVKTFLDIYETEKGTLYIWYQNNDFYMADVFVGDRICIYLKDTVLCSRVKCLRENDRLNIMDTISQNLEEEMIFAEIYHDNNPKREISYWYGIKTRGNSNKIRYIRTDRLNYPIEKLEFDANQITSFQWRKK